MIKITFKEELRKLSIRYSLSNLKVEKYLGKYYVYWDGTLRGINMTTQKEVLKFIRDKNKLR